MPPMKMNFDFMHIKFLAMIAVSTFLLFSFTKVSLADSQSLITGLERSISEKQRQINNIEDEKIRFRSYFQPIKGQAWVDRKVSKFDSAIKNIKRDILILEKNKSTAKRDAAVGRKFNKAPSNYKPNKIDKTIVDYDPSVRSRVNYDPNNAQDNKLYRKSPTLLDYGKKGVDIINNKVNDLRKKFKPTDDSLGNDVTSFDKRLKSFDTKTKDDGIYQLNCTQTKTGCYKRVDRTPDFVGSKSLKLKGKDKSGKYGGVSIDVDTNIMRGKDLSNERNKVLGLVRN